MNEYAGLVHTEDQFTKSDDECPHPEYWHAPDSESAEWEVTRLVAAMACALRPALIVETGSHVGATAEAIGRTLKRASRGQLITIEIDKTLAERTQNRVSGLPVTVVRGSSLDYEPPGPVEFFWLDSDVGIRAEEVRHFLPWTTHRTVFGVHDTGPRHCVSKYLCGLVAEGIIQPPVYLPTPRGVCFFRLGFSAPTRAEVGCRR
jgi:hypothetical protein